MEQEMIVRLATDIPDRDRHLDRHRHNQSLMNQLRQVS